MRILLFLFSILAPLALTHCESYDFARRIAQQGNLLPQSKIARLKVGMSKEDTAILMGTSLLSPLFNENRWDYAYTWRRGLGPLEIKHVSIYFKNNRITQIEHKP